MLQFALRYAQLGWPIFPCHPGSKAPLGRVAPHGFKSATCDPSVIEAWPVDWNAINISFAWPRGILAVDSDLYKDGVDEKRGQLERQFGAFPRTVRVLSPQGGMHEIYKYDPSLEIKNGDITEVKGIEIKGAGRGYTTAPLSRFKNGSYTFDIGALPSETPIAEAPSWLIELAKDRPLIEYGESTGAAATSFLGLAFRAMGWLGVERDNMCAVCCPWVADHSDDRGIGKDSGTAILAPKAKTPLGSFRCQHGHCTHRKTGDALRACTADALVAAATKLPGCAETVASWLEEEFAE